MRLSGISGVFTHQTTEMEFKGYNIFVKQLRADRGFRVEIDVSEDQWDELKEIPNMPEGVYKILIEPIIE